MNNNKMKLFRYKVKCTDTISARNLEDAKEALHRWYSTLTIDFELSDLEEIGNAW